MYRPPMFAAFKGHMGQMSVGGGNNVPLSLSLSIPLCSLACGHLRFMALRFISVPFACSCRFECRKPAILHAAFLFRI